MNMRPNTQQTFYDRGFETIPEKTPSELNSPRDDDKDASSKEIIHDYFHRSSAHGVIYLSGNEVWLRRVVWFAILVTAAVLMGIQISEALKKYYTYPYSVNVEDVYPSSIEFSAVTICSINPIINERLNEVIRIAKATHNGRSESFTGQMMGDISVNHTIARSVTTEELLLLEEIAKMNVESTSSVETSATISSDNFKTVQQRSSEHFIRIFNNIRTVLRNEITYKAEDLILQCTFAGFDCRSSMVSGHSVIKSFDHFSYGKCFTFNGAYDPELYGKIVSSRRPGSRYGLELILANPQELLMAGLASKLGLSVTIHDPKRFPHAEDEGIEIKPGTHSPIAIQLNVHIRSEVNPNHPCYTHITEQELNFQQLDVYSVGTVESYSVLGCLRTCIQRYIISNCRCADPEYKFREINEKAHPCTTESERNCQHQWETYYMDGKLDCSWCKEACSTKDYTYDVSNSVWPTKFVKNQITQQPWLKEFCKNIKEDVNCTTSLQYWQNTFMKVTVFYRQLKYTLFTEKLIYSTMQLISDVGGTMGLFMGLSVITVIEFVDFLFRLLVIKCNEDRNSEKQNQDETYYHVNEIPQYT